MKRITGCKGAQLSELWVVDEATGCWNWALSCFHAGYGQYKHQTAHRWVYKHFCGGIPDGLQLDHLCRNRKCVNPSHLEIVTGTENIRRSSGTKLSIQKVAAILEAVHVDDVPGKVEAVAKEFSVSRSLVRLILQGKIWIDVPGPRRKPLGRVGWSRSGYTVEKIEAMRKMRASGLKYSDIGSAFGTDKSTVHRLLKDAR